MPYLSFQFGMYAILFLLLRQTLSMKILKVQSVTAKEGSQRGDWKHSGNTISFGFCARSLITFSPRKCGENDQTLSQNTISKGLKYDTVITFLEIGPAWARGLPYHTLSCSAFGLAFQELCFTAGRVEGKHRLHLQAWLLSLMSPEILYPGKENQASGMEIYISLIETQWGDPQYKGNNSRCVVLEALKQGGKGLHCPPGRWTAAPALSTSSPFSQLKSWITALSQYFPTWLNQILLRSYIDKVEQWSSTLSPQMLWDSNSQKSSLLAVLTRASGRCSLKIPGGSRLGIPELEHIKGWVVVKSYLRQHETKLMNTKHAQWC